MARRFSGQNWPEQLLYIIDVSHIPGKTPQPNASQLITHDVCMVPFLKFAAFDS